MNKQELIEELECLEVPTNSLDYLKGADYANERAISLAKQLDEPKKVIFSHEEKFVADWLDGLKGRISDKKTKFWCCIHGIRWSTVRMLIL